MSDNNIPEYTIHILQIKMWEWEAIRERYEMSIERNGPDEEKVARYNNATNTIEELKSAIKKLKSNG